MPYQEPDSNSYRTYKLSDGETLPSQACMAAPSSSYRTHMHVALVTLVAAYPFKPELDFGLPQVVSHMYSH